MLQETSLDLTDFNALIGRDLPQPEQFRYEVAADAIRQFAYSVPDGNGLYLDAEYAAMTRWGGIIAPPGYLYAHGSPAWLGSLPGIRDPQGRELTNADNATESWEFFKPVRPGDIVTSYGVLEKATPKRSRKLGDCVLVSEGMRFTNQRGELVAKLTSMSFRFHGGDAAEGGKVASVYPPMPDGQWTRNVATRPMLPGTYEVPSRRYDETLYFEDLAVGDAIAPLTLGPLMADDMAKFNAATNGGGYDRIGRMGHIPDAFAPGVLRIGWFGTMLTRWAGPDAWVEDITQRNEEWVLVGFKVTCGGRVTGKSVVDGRPVVEAEIWCDSELGFRTNSGTARIEMASREIPARSR